MRPLRLGALVGSAVLSSAFAFSACLRAREVGLRVTLAADVRDRAAWIDVAIYEGSCLPAAQLAGGLPEAGAISRTTFRPDESPPSFGKLAPKRYAFAAVARAEDCGVLATGCSVRDVGQDEQVSISLDSVDGAAAVCREGLVCREARCVPAAGSDDSSLGRSCTLDLVGAGPLPNPIASLGTAMSAPAIAATESGFLIAYREFDRTFGRARVVIAPVDRNGAGLPSTFVDLEGRCVEAVEQDGTAAADRGDGALVVVSRAACGQGANAGFDAFEVEPTGSVRRKAYTAVTGASTVAISQPRALARAGRSHVLGFVADGRAFLGTFSDLRLASATELGGTSDTGAWASSSDRVVALFAAGRPAPTDVDGGPGRDAGPLDGADGGVAPTLTFRAVDPTRLSPPLPSASDLGPALWASASVSLERIAVVYGGDVVERDRVRLRFFDFRNGTARPASDDEFAATDLGDILAGDVALDGDVMALAYEQPGRIVLVGYIGASKRPLFSRVLSLGDDARIPSSTRVRDGLVALAIRDGRVLVAWLTARELEQNDPTGGFAMFACRP
jgi:hypothetical protein